MSGMTTISGVMSALCRLFKTGKREDLVDYGKERLIYQITVIWHMLLLFGLSYPGKDVEIVWY